MTVELYRVQVFEGGAWKTRRGTEATLASRAASLADALYDDGTLVRVIDAFTREPVGEPFSVGTIAAVRSVGRFLRGGV